MISAIAGRTLEDADLKLSILAVGDDDQNIYAFRGTNVEFIRRFKQDYNAEVHYLVENYRSTRYIIEAANRVIEANTVRMKTDQPIRIDRHREMLPAGGEFGQSDVSTKGKVQVIQVRDANAQAEATVKEIQRLRDLGVRDWSQIAVLSSTHRELAQVRMLMEVLNVPVRWMAQRDKMVPLHQVREIRRFLVHLEQIRTQLKRASALQADAGEMYRQETGNPWVKFLTDLLESWREESSDAELAIHEVLEFLYEACSESRQEFSYGDGVTLSTVHSAKGTEYNHVLLIGAWSARQSPVKLEENRRAFYVGVTRARQSLSILDRLDVRPSLPEMVDGTATVIRQFPHDPVAPSKKSLNYEILSLEDIHLGYPGRFNGDAPIHAALSRLSPGDELVLRFSDGNGLGFFNKEGVCVSRLSRKGEAEWRHRVRVVKTVRVLAMAVRTAAQDTDIGRREQYQVKEWEVPVLEVVCKSSAE